MASERNRRDVNRVTTISGVSSVDENAILLARLSPTTKRLLVDNGQLAVSEDFDYIGIASTGADEDTLTYKTGGSGGSTVRTLVIGYAVGAEKVSDTITSLGFS
jgi:hypothetical protein